MQTQELSSSNNAVYHIALHLVLVTKYRRKVLTPEVLTRCIELVGITCERWGSVAIECNGEADHVHVLIEIPPRVRLSDLVNNMKTVTSRLLRKEFESVRRAYRKPVLWSPSYCVVSAGGAPLEVLHTYIASQGNPNRKRNRGYPPPGAQGAPRWGLAPR